MHWILYAYIWVLIMNISCCYFVFWYACHVTDLGIPRCHSDIRSHTLSHHIPFNFFLSIFFVMGIKIKSIWFSIQTKYTFTHARRKWIECHILPMENVFVSLATGNCSSFFVDFWFFFSYYRSMSSKAFGVHYDASEHLATSAGNFAMKHYDLDDFISQSHAINCLWARKMCLHWIWGGTKTDIVCARVLYRFDLEVRSFDFRSTRGN